MGKTTFADLVDDRPVIHTDAFMAMRWEDVPDAVLTRIMGLTPFLLEGVMVPRVLRRAIRDRGIPKICDLVIMLETQWKVLSPRQEGMSKSVHTIFDEWMELDRGRTKVQFAGSLLIR